MDESKQPVGRPTDYNQKIADEICEAVATSTDGLKKIAARFPHFPNVDTIYTWRYRHKEFSDKYAEAKRKQADLLVEEITDISDDATNDYIIDENGNEKLNSEHVQRSRLRVDTRKWIACKLLPKVYGEKNKEKDDESSTQSLMQKLIDKL
jgi:hypothetical protein